MACLALASTVLLPLVHGLRPPAVAGPSPALAGALAALAAGLAVWPWLTGELGSPTARWLAATAPGLALLLAWRAAADDLGSVLALAAQLWLAACYAAMVVPRWRGHTRAARPSAPNRGEVLALLLPIAAVAGWWGGAGRGAAPGAALTASALALAGLLFGGLGPAVRAQRSERSFLGLGIVLATFPFAAAVALRSSWLARLARLAGLAGLPWADLSGRTSQLEELAGLALIAAGVALDRGSHRRAAAPGAGGSGSLEQELERRREVIRDLDVARAAAELKADHLAGMLKLFEQAVGTMSLGLTITNAKGKIVYVNEADAAMHGWARDELLGHPPMIYSRGLPAAEAPPAAIGPWRRERFNVTKSGFTFPVRLVSDLVRDERGDLLGTVTICENIREEWELRQGLESRDRILLALSRATETLLVSGAWENGVRELLERLGQAARLDRIRLVSISGAEPQGDLGWSRPGSGMLVSSLPELPSRREVFATLLPRFDSEELLVHSVDDLPPDHRLAMKLRGVETAVLAAVRVRGEVRAVLSVEATSGERRWFERELEAIRLAARLLGAAMGRAEAEQAVAEGEERYRKLVEQSSELIQSVDAGGRFRFVNRAWRETLGYGSEEVAQLTLWDVLAPDQHEHCRGWLAAILREATTTHLMTKFLTRDGRTIPVEGIVSGYSEGGEIVASLGYFRDISQRFELERVKDEFLATVSHELRTPLASIMGSVDLVRGGRLGELSEKAQELLDIAARNSERLLKLVNDLLELQRATAGKIRYHLGPVALSELVSDSIGDIRPRASQVGIRLVASLSEVDAMVHTDRDRATQILLNLLANAIKFSPPGGEVRLATWTDGDRARISVSDRGPGIPTEELSRVFERFSQLQGKTLSDRGFGLGLAIVKELSRGLGAEIEVASEPGAGSTFTLSLPLVEEPAPPPVEALSHP